MLEATLRSDVRPKGLNTATAYLLDEARKRQVISAHEIAALIAPKTHRNRESLTETIAWIHQFLQQHTVRRSLIATSRNIGSSTPSRGKRNVLTCE